MLPLRDGQGERVDPRDPAPERVALDPDDGIDAGLLRREPGVPGVRTSARRKLDEDPEAAAPRRIAEGCTVVLLARAAGLARESQKEVAA